MTKKLIGLLAVALFGITTINAAPFTLCSLTNAPNSAQSTTTAGTPGITGVNPSFTCNFSIPTGDTLGTVSLLLNNPYQNGTINQTNEIQFTYSVSGFAGATALTETVQGSQAPPIGDSGTDPDTGGVSGAGECSQINDVSFQCVTSSFASTPGQTAFTFTVTGSATWLAGSLNNGGGESFTAFVADTYNAPAPEPGTLLMIGGGLIGLVVAGRRKFRA
jgi:hypothetical protein